MRSPSTRLVFLSIALVALSALILALLGEHFLGLVPCQLCIYQRYGFFVIATLALSFALFQRSHLIGLYLSALAFLANGALAFYQVLIEKKMVKAPPSCFNNIAAETVEELRQKLQNAKLAPCDEVSWSLFDISMAGYNALFCFGCCVGIMIYSIYYMKKSQ